MKVQFKSRKLKGSIIKITEKVKKNYSLYKDFIVYGVTKDDGITITGNITSVDLSEYIVVGENTFAFNPYRVNIGSIGLSGKNFEGLVSPAYVVFKTKKDLIPEFLFQYLKSDIGIKLINWYGNRGGVRNALRFDDLGEIDIPDLTVDEQREALIKLNIAQTKLNDIFNTIGKQQTYLQQLRQSILQEAVQGKLSELRLPGLKDDKTNGSKKILSSSNLKNHSSDNNDEDAATLLKRIKAEKQKLIKEGKLKNEKELPPIMQDEIPFELPEGWVWCRLGEIVLKSEAGKSMVCDKRPAEKDEWGIIKVSAMSWGSFDEKENKVLPKGVLPFVQYKIRPGDYLISRANTEELIGKSVIVENLKANLLLSDKSIRIKFFDSVNTSYINFYNNSSIAREYYKKVATGTSDSMKNISREQMYLLPFPLPPLAEQQRIVAKVNKLQQQLNQLESQVQQSREYAQQLLQAVLKEAFEEKGTVYEMEDERVGMVAEE